MFYSNNYSKYIENIRLEKNKKSFQKLVESTKEDKSEKIIVEDPMSTKNSDKKLYVEDDSYGKSRKSVSKEQDVSRKNDIRLEGNYPYLDSQEYSSIQKNMEVSAASKNQAAISAENEFSKLDDSAKVKDVESISEKDDKSINNIYADSTKNISNINADDSLSDKDGRTMIYQYSLSDKDSKNIYVEEGDSVKEGDELYSSGLDSDKTSKNIIDQIKDEKKRGRGLVTKEIIYNKNSKTLPYLTSNKNKNGKNIGVQTYEFDDSMYGYTKKTEAIAYEQGMKYNYYPAGTYSQISGKQANAVDDFISRISNPSNWSTPGKIIVNSVKVANDVADAICIVGPSTNIHTIFSENQIRHDLKIDEPWKFGDSLRNSKYVPRQIQDGVIVRTVTYEKQEVKATDRPIINNGNSSVDFNVYYTTETYKNNDEKVKFADLSPEQLRKDFDYEVDSDNDRDKNNIKGTGKVEGLEGEWESNDFTVFLNPNDENRKEFENQVPGPDEINKDEENNIKGTGKVEGLEGEWESNDFSVFLNPNEENRKKYENKAPNSDEVKKDELYLTTEKPTRSLYKGNFSFVSSTAVDSESNRWYDNDNAIGKIYVIPPYKNLALTNNKENKDVAFVIPLQNNLQFEQTSRGATWTAIQFFGRIGDVQQYSRTGSMDALTLTTKYFVEDESGSYNMSRLQDIEMMYRSLVLPASMSAEYMNNDNSTNLGRSGSAYYYFTRPPLINIVLGKSGSNNSEPKITSNGLKGDNDFVYKNLFTDIISEYEIDDGEEGDYKHSIYYKNYVVTNVAIDKNQNDYNYYIKDFNASKKTGDYVDTMGFTVTLTVIEIDGNYLGSMPSFNNYYNTVKSRGKF